MMTPEVFGRQFGPSDQDVQQVVQWLQSHGFQVAQVSRGRTVIEFSGTAAQVHEALHTSIHKYAVNGETHWANASDPQIPAVLAPVVSGIFSLHNFGKKPQISILNTQVSAKYIPGGSPQFTSSSGLHALTPADYDVIYNIGPSPSGPPAKIAIVGRSNINYQDVAAFHSVMADGASGPQIVVNGPDPGNLGGGEEAEAVLDTTWSGAVAPTATVFLVVSASTNTTDGVDLSEIYIVDNNLADIMSESFGNCESAAGSVEASFHSSLAEQAAAEGITYAVSSGDSGAAGCDDPNSETLAKGPPSVNVLASNPYTVGVGGTMFSENGQDSSYWKTINSPFTLESAISYIPEKVWNESCAGVQCGSAGANILAGGGGGSTLFQKPAWQAGFGDTARDVPDISLTSAEHDPYLLCLENSCTPDSQGIIHLAAVAGTSAAAPSFAGIMAQVAQKTGSRQGLANYVLYRLAAAETFSACNGSRPGGIQGSCVFNDVTLGNNSVPGDADYGSSSAKYQSSTGYDLSTGLGSLNVTNLLNDWNTVAFNATTTSLSLSPLTAVHGAALNLNINVSGRSGTPSGPVWLQAGTPAGSLIGNNTVDIFSLDASASITAAIHTLSGGNYQVNAHYVGDGTFAPSDSSPLTVTINPEPNTTSLSILGTDASGNFVPYTSGQYGIPVYLKAHVIGQSGYGTPSSSVSFFNNQLGFTATLDRNGDGVTGGITNLPPGAYTFAARYTGDLSFNQSTSPSGSFTVTQASTNLSLVPIPDALGLSLTALVNVAGAGNFPTGEIIFYSGSTSLGKAAVTQIYLNGTLQSGANLIDPQLADGQYTMTASYSGDSNYLTSTSLAASVTKQPDFSVVPFGSTTVAVNPGQPAIFELVVNYTDGFIGSVTFTCTGLPAKSTCTAPPISSSNTAVITIATVAPTARAITRGRARLALWVTSLGSGFSAIFLLGSTSRRKHRSRLLPAVLLALAMGLGCGGGGGATTNLVTPTAGTPSSPGTGAGTYNIIVTAAGGTISHSTNLVLTIN